ncbi:MAG TPA: hypothetical protein VHV83_04280 [Armatimonadota bacterium]|nr:hypothetical protein [Armatimonadota bacterium]
MRPDGQHIRMIGAALIERDDQLLLVQLADGPFAGFWLLPSVSIDDGTVDSAIATMVFARTGHPVLQSHLISVIQEPKIGTLALRFLFRVRVGDRLSGITDHDIAQARWFSRDAVHELLEERDTVPNLGVMSVIRAWVDGVELAPLETLLNDALCPCGSGFRFTGCCGWDAT